MNPRIHIVPPGWRVSTVGKELLIENQLREPINVGERASMSGPYPYYGPTKAIDFLDHYRAEGTYALIGEDGDHFLKYTDQDMTQLVSGRFNVNNHAHLVRGNGECTTEWFYEYFRRRALTPYLTRQGVGRYKLNKNALEQLPILVPPKVEQHRIHVILQEWDRTIYLVNQLLAAKRQLREGLMQQLLTEKCRFSRFFTPWKTVHLGEVFRERVEKGRSDLQLLSITAGDGVIPRGDVGRKDTSSEDKSAYLRICPGDIGYNTMRMWQGVSGLSSLEGIVSPAYTVIAPDSSIDAEFMAVFFKYQPVVHLFWRYSQGMVDDTLNLKFTNFAKIKVTIPKKEEQIAIAGVFRLVDREIALLRNELAAFQEQKKGLMQRLLTGKKRVRVTEAAA